ncbi:MAG: phage terminase large subunit, partial [Promethearchaeota archaeon]
SGQSLIQDLKNTRLPIIPITPTKDKVSRANIVSPIAESRKCFLPKGKSWVSDFIQEIILFPNAKHDDQVDAFTQFLNYISNKGLSLKDINSQIKSTGQMHNLGL